MTYAVIGVGASGAHAARQLRGRARLLVHDRDPARVRTLVTGLEPVVGECSSWGDDAHVVIVATPVGTHVDLVSRILERGASVVSISDDPAEIDGLLALDDRARAAGATVVVGAGFAPGLSCLLARFAGDQFDDVDEIAISKSGTGGPACARQHHRALKRDGRLWLEGEWTERRGGSGRELVWFPGALGARDAYRGALASPTLLQRTYPGAARISARMTATRRDRLTSRLPMLRRPHDDGGPGGIRVEMRGRRNGHFETLVYGVMAHPSMAAGLTAAVVAERVAEGGWVPGARGLSEISDAAALLRRLHGRGLVLSTFAGVADHHDEAAISAEG